MAKVLLVEDDNNLREIYQARLQAEGYTIVSARDGEEALVVAKAEKPDLIIADVMMPKISGFEMLDIVRNTDTLKGVKVIMLTALGQSEDQQRADKLGADRYLVKSQVTLEDIVKAAHELLGETSGPAPVGTSTPTTPEGAPEPAAAAPTPEAPTTETKPDEAAPAAPEVKTADKAAEPAKQEATEAEAKIEDFVAGATTEPSTPAGTPAPAAAPPAAATPQPTPPAADETSKKADDDKLMADAVDTLNASAEAKAAPAPAPSEAAKPAADKADTAEEKSAGGSKKVIKPIEVTESKKDIHTLLAEEEAKEKAASAGTLNPPAPQTPVQPNEPGDPNSIAL